MGKACTPPAPFRWEMFEGGMMGLLYNMISFLHAEAALQGSCEMEESARLSHDVWELGNDSRRLQKEALAESPLRCQFAA
jgi:hypothetical protein